MTILTVKPKKRTPPSTGPKPIITTRIVTARDPKDMDRDAKRAKALAIVAGKRY